ncbi:hypothetical protein CHUAL_004514 [Chamberlinius hualienensis]
MTGNPTHRNSSSMKEEEKRKNVVVSQYIHQMPFAGECDKTYHHERNGHHDEIDHNINDQFVQHNHHLNGDHNNNSNSLQYQQIQHNGDDHYPHYEAHSGGSNNRSFMPPSDKSVERKSFSGHCTFPSISSLKGGLESNLNKVSEPDSSNDGDNVNVVIRVRPLPNKDCEEAGIRFPGNGQVLIDKGEKSSGNKPRHFSFNVAFESDSTQEDVFEHCGIKRLIEMAMEGFSCTVFAYGQTGSGKTHTLSGPPISSSKNKAIHPKPHSEGLMQRSFNYLYQYLGSKHNKSSTVIKASYLEIYNEQVLLISNV